MDSDYTSILKFDEDFKNGLGIINPFISGLRTQNYVQLCRLWIDKLIHCAPHERQLRNIYLEQLCRHSQRQVLGIPFNSPPNEGPLQVISQQFLIREGVSLSKHQLSHRDGSSSKHQLSPAHREETGSWSDVSDTSCCMTGSTWQPNDGDEESVDNMLVKKTASSTVSTTGAETACTENTHRIRFKQHSKSSTQNYIKRKCQKKVKRQSCLDSNDESTFKDCFENPIRSKSVASRRKSVRKLKKITLPDNSMKSEYVKGNKFSGNAVKKKASKHKRAKEETDEDLEVDDEEEENDEEFDRESDDKNLFPIKIASRKLSEKENKNDSQETIIEMYKNHTKQLQSLDTDRIIELEQNVSDLKDENKNLLNQLIKEKEELMAKKNLLSIEREQKDILNNQLDTLKNEIVDLRDELLKVEKMKQSMEDEHKQIVNSVNITLSSLSTRVNSAIAKNDKIESIVTKLNNDTEANIQFFQKDMSTKYKALEEEYEEKLTNIKKCHTQTVQNYENTINKLKKDLSNKNKDKMRLEKKLQEKCSEMRTEVENIKRDIEKTSKENEIQLNAKINAYKTKIIKLVKYNQKTTEFYEQKINALNKTKDMELWVQKLNVGSAVTNGKKQELENIISALEEKFRKQLNDATQRTNDYNEQKHKYEEIASELGSDKSVNGTSPIKNKDEIKMHNEDKN